jgi:RNA polymerase sigma-70 factor, ECF subfamily
MHPAQLRAELEGLHAESFGWALRCCADVREDAEEALHAAYLKILDGRARFGGRAGFKTWLFAVIRRTAADERRRHWLRRLGTLRFESRSAPPPAPPQPDEQLADSQRAAVFRAALAALPRRQQEALHLVFYHDLTTAEAATVMGISPGAARQHYERGKARLRMTLSETEHEPVARRPIIAESLS